MKMLRSRVSPNCEVRRAEGHIQITLSLRMYTSRVPEIPLPGLLSVCSWILNRSAHLIHLL